MPLRLDEEISMQSKRHPVMTQRTPHRAAEHGQAMRIQPASLRRTT